MKNNIKLYKSITDISDEFIEEAQQQPRGNKTVKKYGWVKWGAAAACLCLAVCAAAIPLNNEQPNNSGAKYSTAQRATDDYTVISLPNQHETPQSSTNDKTTTEAAAAPTVYKQKETAPKNRLPHRSSVISGNTLTAAGAGSIMPGGALWQMSIANSDSQQESKQPALTDAPLIHAKQIDAAPMVYVNDKLYQNYAALKSVDDIQNEFVYLGDVQSYTRNGVADPVPNQNFQANTPFVGTPINQYGDDVIIYMEAEDEYWLYKAIDTVDTNEREHPTITEEAYPSKTITTDDENIKY